MGSHSDAQVIFLQSNLYGTEKHKDHSVVDTWGMSLFIGKKFCLIGSHVLLGFLFNQLGVLFNLECSLLNSSGTLITNHVG
jgi:hypothetical protein